MISTDDRRNPLKHVTAKIGDDNPQRFLKFYMNIPKEVKEVVLNYS